MVNKRLRTQSFALEFLYLIKFIYSIKIKRLKVFGALVGFLKKINKSSTWKPALDRTTSTTVFIIALLNINRVFAPASSSHLNISAPGAVRDTPLVFRKGSGGGEFVSQRRKKEMKDGKGEGYSSQATVVRGGNREKKGSSHCRLTALINTHFVF